MLCSLSPRCQYRPPQPCPSHFTFSGFAPSCQTLCTPALRSDHRIRQVWGYLCLTTSHSKESLFPAKNNPVQPPPRPPPLSIECKTLSRPICAHLFGQQTLGGMGRAPAKPSRLSDLTPLSAFPLPQAGPAPSPTRVSEGQNPAQAGPPAPTNETISNMTFREKRRFGGRVD